MLSQCRLIRQRGQSFSDVLIRICYSRIVHHRNNFPRQQIALPCFCGNGAGGVLRTAHQRPEFAFFFIVNKQLLGQRGLVIEHINQKTQRANVVAQMIKCAGSPGPQLVHFSDKHLLDTLAHAQNRLRGLVQS